MILKLVTTLNKCNLNHSVNVTDFDKIYEHKHRHLHTCINMDN